MMNIVRTVKNGKKVTTAIVDGCMFDAIKRIEKRFFVNKDAEECVLPNMDKALMHDKFASSVRLADGDTYSEAEGESLAVKKNMEKHNRAFKKAITDWQAAMLKDIMRVSPETFEDALNKIK